MALPDHLSVDVPVSQSNLTHQATVFIESGDFKLNTLAVDLFYKRASGFAAPILIPLRGIDLGKTKSEFPPISFQHTAVAICHFDDLAREDFTGHGGCQEHGRNQRRYQNTHPDMQTTCDAGLPSEAGPFILLHLQCLQWNPRPMSYQWHDLLGNLGVVIILTCYLFVQIERMDIRNPAYSLLNGLGAVLILVSLVYNFNLSSFVIEIAWLAISIFGLSRWYLQKSQIH